MKTVTVKVTNEEEPGVVALNRTQPRVGVAVTASLSDPDGSVSGLTWQWSINGATATDSTPNGDIEDANSATYTPKAGDVGGTLTATAMYDDGQSADDAAKKTANADSAAVLRDTRNKPPAFGDEDPDTDGVQNATAVRKVEENTKALAGDDAANTDDAADNVGMPVGATDPDPNTDPLIYSLGGPDAGSFRVRDNGQIEVGAGTKLDHETQPTYMVTVMARRLLRRHSLHRRHHHGHRRGRNAGGHESPRG